jgi:hypothetical protein
MILLRGGHVDWYLLSAGLSREDAEGGELPLMRAR